MTIAHEFREQLTRGAHRVVARSAETKLSGARGRPNGADVLSQARTRFGHGWLAVDESAWFSYDREGQKWIGAMIDGELVAAKNLVDVLVDLGLGKKWVPFFC